MSLAIFCGLTIDKIIAPEERTGILFVAIWAACFDVVFLFALLT